MNDTVSIYQIKIDLSQEGNTLGTTSEVEEMEITFSTQSFSLEDKDSCFFSIKTLSGWSFNDKEEWINFYDKFISKHMPQ